MSKASAKAAVFEAKKTLGIGQSPNTSPGMHVVLDHFELTHSGNGDAGPFCQHGIVYQEGNRYYLGLQFKSGRFVYPTESFDSPAAVIASMQRYKSASWATSPNGPEYDRGRFGPGTYRKV